MEHIHYKYDKYSVFLAPNGQGIKEVELLKKELRNALGYNFPSYKSKAHISIRGFSADEEVQQERDLLKAFSAFYKGKDLTFNSFSSFANNRTVYLAPDDESSEWLYAFAADYFAFRFPNRLVGSPFTPHITIGRQIEANLFEKAKQTFAGRKISLSFFCNNIALRKYNPLVGQYEAIAHFYFAKNK